MNPQKNDTRSLLIFIGSMLIFGTVGIFRRYIPLPSALLACCRGAIGALFLLLLAAFRPRRQRGKLGVKKAAALALVGGLIGINWLLLFEAYNYTTVATATLCYYMQPTIVVLLSPLVFREKLTAKKVICVLLSLVGMVFVSGAAEGGIPSLSELRGVLCGLGAAALYAAVVIANKKLSGIDTYQKTTIQLFAAAVIMVPYLLAAEDLSAVRFDLRSVIMLLIVGLVHTGITYALYFASMEHLRSQSIALISYLDPIAALLLSALLLHETLTVWGIVGAVLILGAAFVSEWEAPAAAQDAAKT